MSKKILSLLLASCIPAFAQVPVSATPAGTIINPPGGLVIPYSWVTGGPASLTFTAPLINTSNNVALTINAANGVQGLDSSGYIAGQTFSGNLTFTSTNGVVGGATSSRPAAGNVGSLFNDLVAIGSPVSLSTASAKTVISQAVSAGHYYCVYKSNFVLTGNTMLATAPITTGITTSNNTLPTDGSEGYVPFTVTVGSTNISGSTCVADIVLTSPGTIYAVAKATFSAGTVGGFGELLIYQQP
jgi:hypothetical protein